MTLTDLKKTTILEFERVIQKASNGNIILDVTPLIRKCQIISFLQTESVSPNYERIIIEYFSLNDTYKK
jgi:hypothetical protein